VVQVVFLCASFLFSTSVDFAPLHLLTQSDLPPYVIALDSVDVHITQMALEIPNSKKKDPVWARVFLETPAVEEPVLIASLSDGAALHTLVDVGLYRADRQAKFILEASDGASVHISGVFVVFLSRCPLKVRLLCVYAACQLLACLK
jgi:hypothetical protein